MKAKRNPHPEKKANRQGDQLRQRDLKVTEKSAAAGLRRAKQSENHTDHLHQCPREHSLRCSGKRLGTETQALEVSSREQTMVSCVG